VSAPEPLRPILPIRLGREARDHWLRLFRARHLQLLYAVAPEQLLRAGLSPALLCAVRAAQRARRSDGV
jgi:hypothetical protein